MIGRKEIINNIENNQHRFTFEVIKTKKDKVLFSRVISLYFHYMYKSLLAGNKWWMWRFGTFRIEFDDMPSGQLRKTPQYYKGDILLRNKYMMNAKTLGKRYFLNSMIPVLVKYKCRFSASQKFRRDLRKILFENGKIQQSWQ